MATAHVRATYLIETPYALEYAAAIMAGEQSTGTFVSVPGETKALKNTYGARVLAGGGIMAHPGGVSAGVKSMKQGWQAAHTGTTLENYAKIHKELALAIEKFGRKN